MKDDLTQLGNESIKSEGIVAYCPKPGMISRPTQQLRWNKSGQLEQLWIRDDGGVQEWRTIPTEE